MTDTGSARPVAQGEKTTHVESHTSMSERKSREMSHVDTSDASPQVRKSRAVGEKVTPPLPREVTFSGLSIGRPERDSERGEINKPPPAEDGPEPVGAIAERVLDDLAARQQAALDRLRRQKPAIRTKEQP